MGRPFSPDQVNTCVGKHDIFMLVFIQPLRIIMSSQALFHEDPADIQLL